MMRVLALLLGAATVVAAIDIAYKAHAISERGGAVLLHDRPTRYVVAGGVLSLGWAGAVALTRSSSIAFAGGLAFSLGDVAVLVGFALLIPSVLVFRTQRARLASAPATGEA